MIYRKGKCSTCGYLPSSESEYMKPYCTCSQKVMKHKDAKLLSASSMCLLCGKDTPHLHTALEQIIFNNGRKYSAKLSNLQPTPSQSVDEPDYETNIALCEANHIHDSEEYFKARKGADFENARLMFEAGYKIGWQARANLFKPQPTSQDVIDAERYRCLCNMATKDYERSASYQHVGQLDFFVDHTKPQIDEALAAVKESN